MIEVIETKFGKISRDADEFMYDVKFRPTTIEECILPKSDKETALGMIKSGRVDNMTLVSDSPGTGKTTLAKVLCNEVDAETLFVNGADCKIDFIRNELTRFASSMTTHKGGKVIIIDEFDRPGLGDAQKHMRSFIEAYSKNCSVVITCNDISGIHPALLSRCPPVKFGKASQEETVAMMRQVIQRCMGILEIENIKVEDPKVIAALVKKNFPDIRSIVKGIGKYSKKGIIDSGILTEIIGKNIDNVVSHLKNKDFKSLRSEVILYAAEYESFINRLYSALYDLVKPESIPAMVEIIGENNAQYAYAANKEIHLQYLMMRLMMSVAWK